MKGRFVSKFEGGKFVVLRCINAIGWLQHAARPQLVPAVLLCRTAATMLPLLFRMHDANAVIVNAIRMHSLTSCNAFDEWNTVVQQSFVDGLIARLGGGHPGTPSSIRFQSRFRIHSCLRLADKHWL